MIDRHSLINVLTDANIDRQNAERSATVIVRTIRYYPRRAMTKIDADLTI